MPCRVICRLLSSLKGYQMMSEVKFKVTKERAVSLAVGPSSGRSLLFAVGDKLGQIGIVIRDDFDRRMSMCCCFEHSIRV